MDSVLRVALGISGEKYSQLFFIFPQLFRSIVKYILKPTMRMQMNVWWTIGFIRGKKDVYLQKK